MTRTKAIPSLSFLFLGMALIRIINPDSSSRLLVDAFNFSPPTSLMQCRILKLKSIYRTPTTANLRMAKLDDIDDGKLFGGYTAKQRLREEVESPFRTVRLFFFGSSTGSALTALYFSLLNVARASADIQYANPPPPLEESIQSCIINLSAAIICGYLTWRDWNAGEANLARIAKGGALAKLVVSPMLSTTGSTTGSVGDSSSSILEKQMIPLSDYRRNARILIAAGGKEYIETLNRSLNADQKKDKNIYAEKLEASDVVIVPVLLQGPGGYKVGDTQSCWMNTNIVDETIDRNYDVQRSSKIIAFPRGTRQWEQYLESEIQTASKQGFDVLSKGFIIVVKKNGRILRRATGQPPLSEFIDAMEVMDGSKFGMPGDDEKYY